MFRFSVDGPGFLGNPCLTAGLGFSADAVVEEDEDAQVGLLGLPLMSSIACGTAYFNHRMRKCRKRRGIGTKANPSFELRWR